MLVVRSDLSGDARICAEHGQPVLFFRNVRPRSGQSAYAVRLCLAAGIIGRALTATSSLEVATALTTLAETDDENGMIHESFYPNGYWRYTRPEFGWANALGAELVFRSLAGEPATQFARHGPILPLRAALAYAELGPHPHPN